MRSTMKQTRNSSATPPTQLNRPHIPLTHTRKPRHAIPAGRTQLRHTQRQQQRPPNTTPLHAATHHTDRIYKPTFVLHAGRHGITRHVHAIRGTRCGPRPNFAHARYALRRHRVRTLRHRQRMRIERQLPMCPGALAGTLLPSVQAPLLTRAAAAAAGRAPPRDHYQRSVVDACVRRWGAQLRALTALCPHLSQDLLQDKGVVWGRGGRAGCGARGIHAGPAKATGASRTACCGACMAFARQAASLCVRACVRQIVRMRVRVMGHARLMCRTRRPHVAVHATVHGRGTRALSD